MADGVRVAAEKLGRGADRFAIHAQGQELPAHDPRFIPALGVTYRFDGTPGRHTQGGRDWIMGVDFMSDDRADKYDYTNTGELQKKAMNMMHIVNAPGICLFLVLTALIMGLMVTWGYAPWLVAVFMVGAALFAWRVYRTPVRLGWF